MTLTTMIMMMIDGNRGQEFDKVKNNEDQSVCWKDNNFSDVMLPCGNDTLGLSKGRDFLMIVYVERESLEIFMLQEKLWAKIIPNKKLNCLR